MTASATLNYPGLSVQDQAKEILSHLETACPFDTIFLFLEPGCEAVGQGTTLAKAIQAAMEQKFRLWADSWIRPHVEDIRATPGPLPVLEAALDELQRCADALAGQAMGEERDLARLRLDSMTISPNGDIRDQIRAAIARGNA